MSTPPRRGPQGFTLIELMTVIAIIGLLASVALPNFKTFTTRVKRSERNMLISNMRRNAEAAFNERGQWETGTGTSSSSFAGLNPAWTGVGHSAPWDNTVAGWAFLGFSPSGYLRYSYEFYGYTSGPFTLYEVITYSDVDGDGVAEVHVEEWLLNTTTGLFEPYFLSDNPPES